MVESGLVEAQQRLAVFEQSLRHHDERYFQSAAPGDPQIQPTTEPSGSYRALADTLSIPSEERYTSQVSDDRTQGFARVEHRVPMLSLGKAQSCAS